MPRQSRLDYPGALHHVIGRGIEKKFIFKKDLHKSEFYRRLSDNLSRYNIRCYAWCIMGNHFHLLLQSGTTGLSEFMRSLLTGYAVYFNRKHKRSGHLFQNRYKSVLCDKDEYLLPLIRYIHLNPVKARMIPFSTLERYSWTGHREICKEEDGLIHNKDEILRFFGSTKRKDLFRSYKQFIKEGLDSKEDFEGGGLKRSAGGMKNLLTRRKDEREQYDERILGNGDFVEDVYDMLNEADETKKKLTSKNKLLKRLEQHYQITRNDIFKSRIKKVREARHLYVYLANAYLGESLSKIGEEMGISRAAASLARKKAIEFEKKGIVKKLMEYS